ncbi:hypothetical protein [Phenylobacterium montanum]|uniref:Chemotaxis protein CheE n=1 Tax=Phenylobacterium montanum TaxID=2823693 RepID=A0A975IVW0_9CAUL|nr:hypothetical protein [Caulobacter sp. S6]QUD89190.1 hypothetical protein KCG34_04725 [Caulobacter sp. S6]
MSKTKVKAAVAGAPATDRNSIKVKNRLRELMQQPGGRSVVEALRGADQRLGKIRDQCLDGLDRSLARMTTASQALGQPPSPDLIDEIYASANEIIMVAGLFGFEALDEPAHGLCELIDRFRDGLPWSTEAIQVHVAALQLMRGLDKADEAEVRRVSLALREVWVHFGLISPPAS